MTLDEANMTIDYLKEIQEGYIEGEGYERHPLPEWYALEKAIQTIEQTTWIPVSERLPEDEQEIVFSTKTERVHSGKYHNDDSANQWYSHKDKCRAWNNVVNAWMPLPEPYKAESEETETWNGIHAQITAPKGTFERIFNDADDDNDI